ncbi:MAG: ribosome maturation factor RimP [Clostridia bacterium]|nr:ribosome maturation factor RimP [Clostridia bacterium]
MALGRAKIVEAITEMVTAVLSNTDVELIAVETGRENDMRYYRIVVDRKGGVDMNTIGDLSHEFDGGLDTIDMPDEPYNLEVCSPGFDRPLTTDRDYERYEGEDVEVKLVTPVNKKNKYEGKLVSKTADKLIISVKDVTLEFDFENVKQVKRTVIF